MARNKNYTEEWARQTVTIANNTAVSSAINIREIGPRGLAVKVPSQWTAANICFEVSLDNATWIPLRDEFGSVIRIINIQTAEASIYAAPASAWMAGVWHYLRVKSISTAAPVTAHTAANQSAARQLEVLMLT